MHTQTFVADGSRTHNGLLYVELSDPIALTSDAVDNVDNDFRSF